MSVHQFFFFDSKHLQQLIMVKILYIIYTVIILTQTQKWWYVSSIYSVEYYV